MAQTRTLATVVLAPDDRPRAHQASAPSNPMNVWVNLDGDTLHNTGTVAVFPATADQADALAAAFAEAAHLLREAGQ